MRPVEKGAAPRVYSNYKEAGRDLQERIGDYCSYCERRLETHLATEHIQPRCHAPGLTNSWQNVLLSCVNCNSCKGHAQVNIQDYLWPDSDNTLLAIEYERGGLVCPDSSMSADIQAKAQAIITLIGLDKYPNSPSGDPTDADKRWLKRFQVWQIAEGDLSRLSSNNSTEVRELIIENAQARGMFSIWWNVFAGDADMRRRLRAAFPGTAANCFDANEDLQRRQGGQV